RGALAGRTEQTFYSIKCRRFGPITSLWRPESGRDPMGGNLGFDLRHAGERLVPSRLQFPGHQSVGWVGSIVLPEGPIGCIARRFEITPERLTHSRDRSAHPLGWRGPHRDTPA